MTHTPPPNRASLIGVALTSAAILTLEIVLTRIFSVMMWYHFAFMAISMALLGGGVAGVWIYLFPGRFPTDRLHRQLTLFAWLFSLAVILCFASALHIPFSVSTARKGMTIQNALWLALIYLDLAIPFFLGGACMSLAMSRWSRTVGRVYFFDLAGGSLGCLASIGALTALGGPGAVLGVAVLAGAAALAFSIPTGKLRWPAVWTVLTIAVLVANGRYNWLEVTSWKNREEDATRIYERWNSFSRVTIYPPTQWMQPFAWALSEKVEWPPDPGHMLMLIDANAGTPIQYFDGDLTSVQFLKYDLVSYAYYLAREHPKVLTIGPGGGRDVLTGLVFGAREIVGVELNPAVIEPVRNEFVAYAGYVYEQPGVRVVIDDARGYIARSDEQYDIIQGALIDTWAASAAGAFALSENSLYTQEAFVGYYEDLASEGLLTMARWYLDEQPAEALRLVSLTLASWERAGVDDPRQHLAVAANLSRTRSTEGLCVILLKKTPFTAEDVATMEQLYAPGVVRDNPVSDLVMANDYDEYVRTYPLDITAPTDDRPFFFNLIRFGDLLNWELHASGVYRLSREAVYILTALLALTVAMALLLILGPLWLFRRRALGRPGNGAQLLYFAALGLGYMLVEIPLVQRLTIYLGHPVYALTVVLFSLLLFSGLGSLITNRIRPARPGKAHRTVFLCLGLLIAAHVTLIPWWLGSTQSWHLPLRLMTSLLLLAPMGFVMGMPFPMRLRRAEPDLIPWFWGVNGSTSVLGSVLAIVVALNLGFRVAMLVGLFAYATAFGTGLAALRCSPPTLRAAD